MPVSREARAIRGGHRLGLPVSSHEIWPAFALGGDRVEHLRGTSRLGWSAKQSDSLRMYGDAVQIVGQVRRHDRAHARGGRGLPRRAAPLSRARCPAPVRPVLFRRGPPGAAGAGGTRRPQAGSVRLRASANARRSLRDLAASGARVVAGTDAPIFPYGLSLLAELRAFRDAGLPADAVLRAATSDAAAAIGAGDQLGRLAPGMLADLLIVAGDPLADPLELARVEMVITNGIPVPAP